MSKTKKIISVVLAVALVMAMATVAMVSASAATTVYFENSEGWAEVNCYTFVDGASNEGLGPWPGSPCTFVDGNVWSMEVPDDCTHIIFNAGSNGPQTNNLVNQGGGYIAKLGEGTEAGEYGETKTIYVWEAYDVPTETTAATVETTAAEVTTTAAAVETTVAEVETTAAAVETTVVTEPAEVETTVATSDEEPTTVATGDEEPTTAVVEPTTVVTEPVETTAATVETTAAVVETTAATVETTAAAPETTAATVETTAVAPETTAATVETTVAAEADAIVVGGVEYTANVGDVITYTATLSTPKAIENIQAYTTYDSAKLKLVSDATTMFPNMLGVVANPQDGVIYFNASEITKGFDFTAGQVLITLQFEVLDNTYSEITTTIQEMVEFFGGDYITGGEIVADGVVLTETLEVPEVITTTTETEEVTTDAPATEEKTDATSATEDEKKPAADVVPTGVAATIYVVLAVLAMAAAAVVVLRKKVNG